MTVFEVVGVFEIGFLLGVVVMALFTHSGGDR